MSKARSRRSKGGGGPLSRARHQGHTALIRVILFTPDGSELILASDDKTIRVRDVATGASCARLVGLGRAIWSVAFSPDGRSIARGHRAPGDYTASRSSDAHVAQHTNEGAEKLARFINAAQLKQHFYRPNIVTRARVFDSATRAVNEARDIGFALSELLQRKPLEFPVCRRRPSTRAKSDTIDVVSVPPLRPVKVAESCWVDTCHSGNAFNARPLKDVADASIAVYAATDAETLAQEWPALGRGVFTHAVIEGLKGSANLSHHPFIEAQELSTYVEGEVRKLTDDKQLPTFIQSGRLGLRDLEGPLTTITCPRAG